jgi:hypothetical protein
MPPRSSRPARPDRADSTRDADATAQTSRRTGWPATRRSAGSRRYTCLGAPGARASTQVASGVLSDWIANAGLVSHTESCASHGFDRCASSAHLDLRCALPAEQVEQHLARRSGDAGGRFSSPRPNSMAGPCPVKLKSRALHPAGEEPRRLRDIAPQGLVHRVLVGSGAATVGSAHVLLVNEELVEVGTPAHPPDTEEARRGSRSDRRGEPGKILARHGSSSLFGQTAPRTGQDKPGAGEIIMLPEHQVRGDITGRPRLEERRRLGTELVEQVAELFPLHGVEELSHIAECSQTGSKQGSPEDRPLSGGLLPSYGNLDVCRLPPTELPKPVRAGHDSIRWLAHPAATQSVWPSPSVNGPVPMVRRPER